MPVQVFLGDSPAAASAPEPLARQIRLERDELIDKIFPAIDATSTLSSEEHVRDGSMLTFNQLSERYKCKIEVLSGGINQGTKGGGGNFERLKAAEGDVLLSVRFPFVFKEPCLKLFSPERGGLGVWNIHPGALPGYAGLQVRI